MKLLNKTRVLKVITRPMPMYRMMLGDEILKILNKQYEPETFIETTFKRYDLAFKTDEEGRPVLLFIGKRGENGKIKGERFARRLVTAADGSIAKNHWDNKGKVN